MLDPQLLKLEDKKYLANSKDRATNTDKILNKLEELRPKKEVGVSNFSGVEVITLKGEQGEKGEKGEQGERGEKGDSIVGPQGPKGFDSFVAGPKGDQGEQGQPGLDGKNGVDGKDGQNGRNGQNGSPDSGLEIAKKLTELKGEDRLDVESLKGLDRVENNFLNQAKALVPRSLAGMYDLNIPNPSDGQVLTYQASTRKWIASTPTSSGGSSSGSSLSSETPTGTINGTNRTFTVSNTPVLLQLGSNVLALNVDYTYSAGTITTTVAPQLNIDGSTPAFISYYNSTSSGGTSIANATPTANPLVWTISFNPVLIIADNQPFYNGVGVDVTGSGPYTLTFVNPPTTVACTH